MNRIWILYGFEPSKSLSGKHCFNFTIIYTDAWQLPSKTHAQISARYMSSIQNQIIFITGGLM